MSFKGRRALPQHAEGGRRRLVGRLLMISVIISITLAHILCSALNDQRAVWFHTHLYDVFTVTAEEN